MTHRFQLCVTVLVLSTLLGCSTGKPPVRISRATAAVGTSDSAPDRAEADYERNVRTYTQLVTGLSHDLNGEPALALEAYWQSALSDPSDETLVLEVARRLIAAEQFDRAIQLLNRAAKEPNASAGIYAFLGLAYTQSGEKEKAIEANRIAIEKDPNVLPAYQNLAHLYLELNQSDKALDLLDQAAARKEVGPEFLVDLAELYARFARAKPEQADAVKERLLKTLNRAAELDPQNPVVLQKLADGFFQAGELTRAEPIYVDLLDHFPQLLLVRGKLAEIYLRTDRNQKAIEQLKSIARMDPTNPRTHSFLGALALEENKPDEAAEYFERALLLNPELEPIYYELAGIHLNLDNPEDALELLDKARAKFKLNFVLEFYTGIAHVMLKRYSEAVRHLTSAEVLAKTDEPARLNHQFYFQLGAAYERSGDIEQAEQAFRKCLDLAPDHADALNYLGYMWAERGTHLEEAHQLIERAIALEPKNAAFLDSMGWVLFKLNRPEEALDYILQAIELSEEPDPTLYDHLGDIYRALNRMEAAREAWRKALEVEPNEAIQKKLEETSTL